MIYRCRSIRATCSTFTLMAAWAAETLCSVRGSKPRGWSVPRAQLERVPRGRRGFNVPRVPRAPSERAPLAHKVSRAFKVYRVSRAFRESKEIPDPPGNADSRAQQAQQAQQDPVVRYRPLALARRLRLALPAHLQGLARPEVDRA